MTLQHELAGLIGSEMPSNGAQLLSFGMNNPISATVLCMRDAQYHPYVVWTAYHDASSGALVTEHGGYFATMPEAMENYSARGGS